MNYRIFPKIPDCQVSVLGFGLMRLPLLPNSEEIDKEKTRNLVKLAVNQGINYFDTAYPYHQGKSEIIFGEIGKEETFRCRYGTVYLYVEGEGPDEIKAKIPEGMEEYFTCRKEIILKPGDQYTIMPNTLHWFQADSEGAIVSEFSTKSRDEYDIYTDPRIDAAGKRNV